MDSLSKGFFNRMKNAISEQQTRCELNGLLKDQSKVLSTPKLVCPNCGFATDNEPDVYFCRECGKPLCHKCPNCKERLVASELPSDYSCPNCGAPLAQCEKCGWIAPLGTVKCENPSCSGRMKNPNSTMVSVFGGDYRRLRFQRLEKAFFPRENLVRGGLKNRRTPTPKTIELGGAARFISIGERIVGVTEAPCQIIHISFRDPEPESRPLDLVPEIDLPDCIAADSKNLYIIHKDGAAILNAHLSKVSRSIQGRFLSQLVSESFWALLESEDDVHVSLRFFDFEGNELSHFPNLQFTSVSYPKWTMPVSDGKDAIYLTDGEGNIWRVTPKGEKDLLYTPNDSCNATLAVDDRYLWFLPTGKESSPVRIDLRTKKAERLQISNVRNPLAAALTPRSDDGRIWLGFQSKPYLRGAMKTQPSKVPLEVPDVSGPVRELMLVTDPEGSTLLLGLVEGARDIVLQAWWIDEIPVRSAGTFSPPFPIDSDPHILAGKPHHASVWYSYRGKTYVHVYKLE